MSDNTNSNTTSNAVQRFYEVGNQVLNVRERGDRDLMEVFKAQLANMPREEHGAYLNNVLSDLIKVDEKMNETTDKLVKWIKRNKYIVEQQGFDSVQTYLKVMDPAGVIAGKINQANKTADRFHQLAAQIKDKWKPVSGLDPVEGVLSPGLDPESYGKNWLEDLWWMARRSYSRAWVEAELREQLEGRRLAAAAKKVQYENYSTATDVLEVKKKILEQKKAAAKAEADRVEAQRRAEAARVAEEARVAREAEEARAAEEAQLQADIAEGLRLAAELEAEQEALIQAAMAEVIRTSEEAEAEEEAWVEEQGEVYLGIDLNDPAFVDGDALAEAIMRDLEQMDQDQPEGLGQETGNEDPQEGNLGKRPHEGDQEAGRVEKRPRMEEGPRERLMGLLEEMVENGRYLSKERLDRMYKDAVKELERME